MYLEILTNSIRGTLCRASENAGASTSFRRRHIGAGTRCVDLTGYYLISYGEVIALVLGALKLAGFQRRYQHNSKILSIACSFLQQAFRDYTLEILVPPWREFERSTLPVPIDKSHSDPQHQRFIVPKVHKSVAMS